MSDADCRYHLNNNNEFVIENYNKAAPFSSFLPAISGLLGRPMWVFYVNRGQCISSFGINNKDYSIVEFQPANKAYRQTSLQGFRTFIKVTNEKSRAAVFYEPFQDFFAQRDYDVQQKLSITSYDIKLEEVNNSLGLKFEAGFCTLPGEKLSGLIKSLKITNISETMTEIEVLDGLPLIIPYYLINNDMKNESNLRQAWMGVEHYDTLPFYKIKVLPYDTPETVFIEGGNYYLNFDFASGRRNISRTIVEPALIFGNVTDLSYPEGFLKEGFSVPGRQVDAGVTPCGFGYKSMKLSGGRTDTTYTLTGSCGSYDMLVDFVDNILDESYIKGKIEENKKLIEGLKRHIFTYSSSKEFDLYCGQTFMDNFLRGGYPVNTGNGKHTFYAYSRKHGDLEREYNFFQIDSSYYSQGNSNFRDINQNRRNDVSFFPFTGDTNIRTFFDLIQLDGFNPLVLKGSRFTVDDRSGLEKTLKEYTCESDAAKIGKYLSKPYTPGSLLEFTEYSEVKLLKGDLDQLLNAVLSISSKEDIADFQEGYWVDHWIYNTDLLEQFSAVYPDQAVDLLFNRCEYTYYDNYEIVMPRDKKYVLTSNGVRQIGSVKKIEEKKKLIEERLIQPKKVRTNLGKGKIYKSTLASKIICLITNKIASLDPMGIGVEMESDKPGWCDALNGLPAIFGSSINESAEIMRLARFILHSIIENRVNNGLRILMPEEVYLFYKGIYELLSSGTDGYEYWEGSHQLKEAFRARIVFGIDGKEAEITVGELTNFLEMVVAKVNKGLTAAYNKHDRMYYTYFINEVTEYEIIKDEKGEDIRDKNGFPFVKASGIKQRPIPYFLEGPVHVLRTEEDIGKSRSLYNSIRKSGLYDEPLGMYKVNDNIMAETKEIGRQNIFPRGWLENEAVFLHMEYKYFLELLRCGLYEEFFECFRKAFVPFLEPDVYGRSILENSSFIASTVHPDPKVHGKGFVSRLTGASAEVLTMWLWMTAGKRPFTLNEDGQLCLEFKPVLPGWLFTDRNKAVEVFEDGRNQILQLTANTFAFNFLGNTITVYHNEGRKDTFGQSTAVIERIELHMGNETVQIEGSQIPMPYALDIRNNKVDRIDVYMK